MPKMSCDVAERDDRERGDRGDDRDHRREREQPADRRARPELLLGQQLDDVGQRLQRAERADAVGAVAVLEAAQQLALGDQHDRDDLEADGEDDDRLDDLDPPGLVVGDVARIMAQESFAASSAAGGSTEPEACGPRPAGRRRRCPRGRRCPPGSRRAGATTASTARAAGADASPSRRRRASRRCGVGGRQLDARCAARGTAAPASARPRGRPRSSGRCRGAAGRSASAAGVGRGGRRRASVVRPGGRGARVVGPAHALAADLVERQPGVERAPPRRAAGRPCGAGEDAQSRRRGAWPSSAQDPPARARRRPGGRSPGAGAARGRRGA